MNIKSLRKNYSQLSKRERLILYDSAENRDDQGEMDAIMLATPNQDWIKPDFALQAEQILKMRLVMFAQHLKHCRKAMYWFALSVADQSVKGAESDDFFFQSARLNAYFYCVSVKTSRAIFEELGLDVEAWERKRAEIFDLDFADDDLDRMMRNIAFDEKSAEEFINKIASEHGIKQNVDLGFTVKKEVEGLRKILKKQGFKDFFNS